MKSEVKLIAEINETILSSESKCFKTSLFAKETEILLSIDKLLLKLWETIIKNISTIKLLKCEEYKLNCLNANFFFRFGYSCGNNLQPNDIVFVKVEDENENKILNENYFYQKFVGINKFNIIVSKSSNINSESFEKLYGVYDADFMNFPLLNQIQQKIVSTENKNLLVQGVAGSGKTNVCVAKIIYSASKEYRGKILYTTYSKSLLNETKEKIEIFKYNLKNFLNNFKNNSLVFLDFNHKKAIENRLNIYFSSEDDENIQNKIEKILTFLNNVDFMLIENLYQKVTNKEFSIADEKYFLNNYFKNIKNHILIAKIEKLKNISKEVIYKEIYGLIFGCFDLNNKNEMLLLNQYIEKRKGSFNSIECEAIYSVAKDYYEHLKVNNLTDNNLLSRELIEEKNKITIYSLAIIDEVQDFTEVNLCLFKLISRKLFCVGDALQMVNPTFFSFAYLKRLMFDENISQVEKLENNYRNTKKLQQVVENLNKINTKLFGKHNFVVEGRSVESGINSLCIKICDKEFIESLSTKNYSGLTIITANNNEKIKLKNVLPKYEILTVSEIKGLERENVILYNLISSNQSKWNYLINKNINRKIANENSVFRYYFNLFYVGLTRAKQNVFVFEETDNLIFKQFLTENFENLNNENFISLIEKQLPVFEISEKEVKNRINEFLQLAQYDNARFLVSKLSNIIDQNGQLKKIEIFERKVHSGKYQEAGILLWKEGFYEDAKKQFILSQDYDLVELVDACVGNGKNLSINILPYYVKFKDNQMVVDIIHQVLLEDIELLENKQKIINKCLSEVNNNGK